MGTPAAAAVVEGVLAAAVAGGTRVGDVRQGSAAAGAGDRAVAVGVVVVVVVEADGRQGERVRRRVGIRAYVVQRWVQGQGGSFPRL